MRTVDIGVVVRTDAMDVQNLEGVAGVEGEKLVKDQTLYRHEGATVRGKEFVSKAAAPFLLVFICHVGLGFP